ncbi:transcriptional repressor proteinral negative regulator of transcription subunit 4 [Puccinia graminis f. sp. tritici]|uniref:Transcriptional repressor proteinral negative regulator of transcription subunit 4 n=1 Tax=Puccinia graminis f. sp. tritici TaxID=56615 RepID=A0A5B0QWU1_PUCGR|nr:transcriptional repressor proteinral negative regulator of transcription subunit 4 [Puccinia graminis f. sp. tritici]
MHAPGHHEQHINGGVHGTRERRMDLAGAGFGPYGQTAAADLGSEFNDPAIVNIRMANNPQANNPQAFLALPPGPDQASHPALNEIHAPFSLANAGFNHLLARANPGAGYRPPTQANDNPIQTQFGFQSRSS